jgi:hypothetical protein
MWCHPGGLVVADKDGWHGRSWSPGGDPTHSLEPVGAVDAVRGSAIGEWRTVRVDVEWPGGISRPSDYVIHCWNIIETVVYNL